MAGKPLSGIGFYGAVGGRVEMAGATMFRNVHRQAMAVPEHEHPIAYFALLLQGNYREPGRGDEVYFTPFTTAYQPEGTRHRGKVEACGCDFFTVEVAPQVLRENEAAKALSHPVVDCDGGKLLWLMLQLYSEYCQQQDCCPMTVESLLLESLAAASRSKRQWSALFFRASEPNSPCISRLQMIGLLTTSTACTTFSSQHDRGGGRC